VPPPPVATAKACGAVQEHDGAPLRRHTSVPGRIQTATHTPYPPLTITVQGPNPSRQPGSTQNGLRRAMRRSPPGRERRGASSVPAAASHRPAESASNHGGMDSARVSSGPQNVYHLTGHSRYAGDITITANRHSTCVNQPISGIRIRRRIDRPRRPAPGSRPAPLSRPLCQDESCAS
jgi:hypothetical protein